MNMDHIASRVFELLLRSVVYHMILPADNLFDAIHSGILKNGFIAQVCGRKYIILTPLTSFIIH